MAKETYNLLLDELVGLHISLKIYGVRITHLHGTVKTYIELFTDTLSCVNLVSEFALREFVPPFVPFPE